MISGKTTKCTKVKFDDCRRIVLALILCISGGLHASAQQTTPAVDPAAMKEIVAGRSALASRHYAQAETAFKKANKIQHGACYVCCSGLAEAQLNLGNVKDAEQSAAKALVLAENDADRAAAHALRAYILSALEPDEKQKQKTLKAEESEYRQAVALDGNSAEYHLRLGLTLMKETQDEEGEKEVSRYLELEPQGRYAAYARKLEENPRRAREDYAPDFKITTLQGETISLDQLGGRFVVLDFWATWCPPCRESVGDLKELTKKYSPDEVTLISVSADQDEAKWREFVAKKSMDWPQYRDADSEIERSFGIRAYPTYIVIDPNGIIRERIVGENPQQTVVYRLKDALKTLTASNGKE